MQHAKKFYLLDSSKTPHNNGYQFTSKERRQPLEQREIQNLDRRMLEVVNNTGLNEEQKVVEYNKLLTEFQSAHELSSHRISKPLNQMKTSENEIKADETSSKQNLRDYNPMLGITKPYQGKAEKLLSLLDSTKRFDIAENGEIIIDKRRIPRSNISDALSKAVNPQSKLGDIPGWQEFTSFLNERNPPQTLVGSRTTSHKTASTSSGATSIRQSRSKNRRSGSQSNLIDHWTSLKHGKTKRRQK